MPNQPRPDNPARQVRVEDDLWHAAAGAAEAEGTTRGAVMREALRDLVARVVVDEAGDADQLRDFGPSMAGPDGRMP